MQVSLERLVCIAVLLEDDESEETKRCSLEDELGYLLKVKLEGRVSRFLVPDYELHDCLPCCCHAEHLERLILIFSLHLLVDHPVPLHIAAAREYQQPLLLDSLSHRHVDPALRSGGIAHELNFLLLHYFKCK